MDDVDEVKWMMWISQVDEVDDVDEVKWMMWMKSSG